MTISSILTDLYSALNATAPTDLVWWTADQLAEWMDESAEALGRQAGVFVSRDTSTSTVSGGSSYNSPARVLSVLHVSLGTRTLRPITVAEAEAKDTNWKKTAATGAAPVKWWSPDAAGLNAIQLVPVPAAVETLKVVHHTYPDTITNTTTLSAPAVLGDHLYFSVLAGARGSEGQARMPEVAGQAGKLAELYAGIFGQYFGGAE